MKNTVSLIASLAGENSDEATEIKANACGDIIFYMEQLIPHATIIKIMQSA